MLLVEQYTLVRSSRRAMLQFIDDHVAEQLIAPITEFNGNSIRYMLVHTINTYIYWIANFSRHQNVSYLEENNVRTLKDLPVQFRKVDELVADFLTHFPDIHLPVSNNVDADVPFTVTPLQLFTHVITHEFHHKGQIMTMCRLLGHIPTDTDIIRF